jgi:TRAP-type C4-dicarboxylate transport system permease large subunit
LQGHHAAKATFTVDAAGYAGGGGHRRGGLVLFIGCFLDATAAITILVPILLPIAQRLGVDPVHFGVIIALNLMIGPLHPSLGMVLFVLSRVANLSVERTTVAILPWLVPLFLALIAITFVSAITLWLPSQLGLIR